MIREAIARVIERKDLNEKQMVFYQKILELNVSNEE